jgi:galactoside O-acetyltransferase
MRYFPPGTTLTTRQVMQGILGLLAARLWLFPEFGKRLHAWRGVRFKDRRSVFLGVGVFLDNRYPQLIEIGSDVWIAGNSTVLCHSWVSNMQRVRYGMTEQVAPVVVHDGVFVGAGSVLLPGTVLGEGCYVSAHSVVSGTFPPGVLIAGVPARVVRALGPPQ